jgi:DNA-binding NarL/FixJ family response regulator
VRVALADDSVLFRRGLRRLLEDTGVEVVAECDSGDALLQQLDTTAELDAVVLDIRMPPTFTNEGIATAAQIRRRHPRVGVLVLSTYAESGYASELLAAGSSHLGYLLKDRVDDAGVVRDALVRLADGGSVLDPGVVARLVARRNQVRALDRLTDRERAVLAAMAEGRSNIGIGQQLYLSPKTVEAHIASIFAKLDMPVEGDTNRRVRAVLHWLNAEEDDAR